MPATGPSASPTTPTPRIWTTCISALVQFARETQPFVKIRIIPGVELTHVPPGQIAAWCAARGSSGRASWFCTGKRSASPWRSGTNRAGIEAGVDILAHPGLISEEEVRLAAANGVHLEVSARFSHGLGNGRVVALAREAGASTGRRLRRPLPVRHPHAELA